MLKLCLRFYPANVHCLTDVQECWLTCRGMLILFILLFSECQDVFLVRRASHDYVTFACYVIVPWKWSSVSCFLMRSLFLQLCESNFLLPTRLLWAWQMHDIRFVTQKWDGGTLIWSSAWGKWKKKRIDASQRVRQLAFGDTSKSGKLHPPTFHV